MVRAGATRRNIGSPLFWILLLVLAFVAIGVRLCTTESGQALLVRYRLTRHFLPQLTTRLDVALAERFLAMGLLRGDLKAKRNVEAGRELRVYEFAAPRHLTPAQCNLEVTRAARGVAADVVRAEEHHDHGGELVLWLGFGSQITHRVVVRPPSSQAVPAVAARSESGPRIALIIDDFGNNLNETARGFLELGVPITVAVLPELSKSEAVFDVAAEHGFPTLLHLPMEPTGGENPGKDPIRVGMPQAEIEARIAAAHERYPAFVGVNNHMGSRATADVETMRALMQVLRQRDLIFVDSQTTPHSVAYQAARAAGVWGLRNDLFLDNGGQTAENVGANLVRLGNIARRRGLAVGIGHPHPGTLAALRAVLPRLRAEGIHFVTVDDLRPQPRVAAKPNP